ncbi:ABC transporter permease [Rhodoferax sp.]|jgi:putrescine transport system permease protein|uniref:ABC transporter permease n=1 Tax=Rhodoferax sp. TaxID=50421 RepID=UPI0037833A16
MSTLSKWMGRGFLTVLFLFFYLPIACVVFYSFNASPLASEWAGFSLHWYFKLLEDDELLNACRTSLLLALATACSSVVVGAWIGYVLATYRRFAGSTLFSAMVNAPLVLPEVISGMALLLLFVSLEQSIGWPQGRGMVTMWIGHTMLCISYVAITVQARLASMDRSLTEAARDLGAAPLRVFFDITLPLIAPSLFAGWVLSFTISLDDVIMSAFLSGPDTTTLPLVLLSRIRLGLNPEINAVGTLIIAVVSIGVIGNSWYLMHRERVQARLLAQAALARSPRAGQTPLPS